MSTVSSQKKELREKLLFARNSISEREWEEKSMDIMNHVLGSQLYQEAGVIHTFVSMNARREVNTHPLISKMLEAGKEVVIPKTNFEKEDLIHTRLESFSELSPNKWGVLEPKEVHPLPVIDIELVLVPLLAVDKEGNRLGYGKGFYDRFLKDVSVPALGLVFEDFVLESIPVDTFDQKLNGFISEKGITYT